MECFRDFVKGYVLDDNIMPFLSHNTMIKIPWKVERGLTVFDKDLWTMHADGSSEFLGAYIYTIA